jgi:hypothetical protein
MFLGDGGKHLTPWLDVHCDNGLRGRLYLAGLLLVVLRQTLRLQLLGLLILLVITAKQVDLIVILLGRLLRGLCGVEGELGGLGTVGSVLLGGVTRQSGKLRLEGENVVVPAPGVGVLLGRRDGLDLLEDLDIGLGGSVASFQSVLTL